MISPQKKKFDMELNVNRGNIFADQTPTPTRFFRNCEEVGLFQDLNPFDETFRKATEAVKNGEPLITKELAEGSLQDDSLHTPDVFPHMRELHRKDTQQKTLQEPKNVQIDQKSNSPVARRKRTIKDHSIPTEPVILLCNKTPVSVKISLPKTTPNVKVFSPKYFSRFSKNIQNEQTDARKNCGRKKKSEVNTRCVKTNDETREINRLAAIRTRNKKKHYLSYLEHFNKQLLEENAQLKAKVAALTEENTKLKISRLNTEIMAPDKHVKVELCIGEKADQNERVNAESRVVMPVETVIGDSEKESFYSSIPDTTAPCQLTVITNPPFAGDVSNPCFLRKPFKKRNLNP